MNCAACQYLVDHRSGIEGDPGADAMHLSSKELARLACTLARVGTLVCDMAGVPAMTPPRPHSSETPYIWDIKED